MAQEIATDISAWDKRMMQAFIVENAASFRVFASRYVDDPEVIDDLLQEAYIKFWTRRASIGKVDSPRNYFFSIIKNTALDYWHISRKQAFDRLDASALNISDDNELQRHIIEQDCSECLARALMQLSPQSRQVILMTLDECSMQEIADTLGVSVNTVKTVKYRALKRLSELLSREDFLWLFVFCTLS